MIEGSDLYLRLMDPDPGGPKNLWILRIRGSATLIVTWAFCCDGQAGALRPDLPGEVRGGGWEPGYTHPRRNPRDQGDHCRQPRRPGRHQPQGTVLLPPQQRDCLTRWIWLWWHAWPIQGPNRGRGQLLNFLGAPVEAAVRRQFISARRPSRDSRYAAVHIHCAYTLVAHTCVITVTPHMWIQIYCTVLNCLPYCLVVYASATLQWFYYAKCLFLVVNASLGWINKLVASFPQKFRNHPRRPTRPDPTIHVDNISVHLVRRFL